MFDCARVWLLSWTAYGEWVPGDPRGFVGRVRDLRPGESSPTRLRHNAPRTEYDRGITGLARRSRERMAYPPVRLSREQADALLTQFAETAAYRRWRLLAAAVMTQHVHLLVGVPDDPDPDALLRDFKAYGSRALNRLAGVDAPARWWTKGGSTRKKGDPAAVLDGAAYVRDQERMLAGAVDPEVAEVIGPRGCDWRERERTRAGVRTGD